MINNLIQKWIHQYLDDDIIAAQSDRVGIYDALLVEHADCSRLTQAMIVMNNCPVSNIAIKEALYTVLAKWGEHKMYRVFIDTCIQRLGHLNPQNAPALLTNIMIGGAYPYLIPALKLHFVRGEKDFTISKQVIYGPDLSDIEDYPESRWCDFVDWLASQKELLHTLPHPGIAIDKEGLYLKGKTNAKYLRTKKFSKLSKYTNWRALEFSLSDWKKIFLYYCEHSKEL